MGLGPPVCTDCKIICSFNGRIHFWHCPICASSLFDTCLWELDKKDYIEYKRNTKAFKQVKKLKKNATLDEIKEVVQNILEENKNE